jgi:metal-responsive CopG/Arc/MetJ family transcriptional regulator
MSNKSVRRSINLTPEMCDQLAQIVAKSERNITEADLIRDAIRQYLDQQADLIGSRRHFQKSLQAQFERFESTLTLYLHVMIALLLLLLDDDTGQSIDEAIVIARRDGKRLLARIEAVRDLKVQP